MLTSPQPLHGYATSSGSKGESGYEVGESIMIIFLQSLGYSNASVLCGANSSKCRSDCLPEQSRSEMILRD
jgi:hypothetical protein